MKYVLLLAGIGRRIINEIDAEHKSLILLDEKPIIYYILKNIEYTEYRDVILILGYKGHKIIKEIQKHNFNLNIEIVWNHQYETTNNLYSLLQAEEVTNKTDFVIINGDMIFDWKILKELTKEKESSIAVDFHRSSEYIDSPGIKIMNDRIVDLGRHITNTERSGYSIGIYKISNDLRDDFFRISKQLLLKDLNKGFHDPLVFLFNTYKIMPFDVKDKLWMDIDDSSDIKKGKNMLKKLLEVN